MGFTLITVTGTYINPDGSPAAGSVVFEPTAVMEQPSGDIVGVSPIVGELVLGVLSVVLAANDDPTTTPTGVTYTVTEYVGSDTRVYNVVVPHGATGATVDLSALAPTTTIPVYSYILAPSSPTTGYVLTWNGTAWVAAVGGSGSANATTIQSRNVSASAPSSGQALVWNGTAWAPTTLSGTGTVTSVTGTSGDITVATGTTTPVLDLAAVGPGVTGPIGSGTTVPVISIDTKGRVTALGSTAITVSGTGTVTSVTGATGDISVTSGTTTPVLALAAAGPGATGPIGSTTTTPVITIDSKGRVTALTSATIAASGGTTTLAPTVYTATGTISGTGQLAVAESSGAMAFTLPASPGAGALVGIYNATGTGATVTVNANTGQTIEQGSNALSAITIPGTGNGVLLAHLSGVWYPVGSIMYAAGGDLSGIYPSPTVAKVNGVPIPAANATLLSQINNYTARSVTGTLGAGESTLFLSATQGATLTLPTAPQVSTVNTVVNFGPASVTVAGPGTLYNVNGSTGSVVVPSGGAVEFTYGPGNWYVSSTNLGGRPVFNVLAYGADPTGVTECSAKINAAIAAAGNNGGGTVYFPAGNYNVASPLSLGNGNQVQAITTSGPVGTATSFTLPIASGVAAYNGGAFPTSPPGSTTFSGSGGSALSALSTLPVASTTGASAAGGVGTIVTSGGTREFTYTGLGASGPIGCNYTANPTVLTETVATNAVVTFGNVLAVYVSSLTAVMVSFTSYTAGTGFAGCQILSWPSYLYSTAALAYSGIVATTSGGGGAAGKVLVTYGTASTFHHVTLEGEGAPGQGISGFTAFSETSSKLVWSGGAGNVVQVLGPISGWGVRNLFIQCSGAATGGVNVTVGQAGLIENVFVDNPAAGGACFQFTGKSGFASASAGGYAMIGTTMGMFVTNLGGYVTTNGSCLIKLDGDTTGGGVASANTTYSYFSNLYLSVGDPGASNSVFGIYHRFCDNILIRNITEIRPTSPVGSIYDAWWDYTAVSNCPQGCLIDSANLGNSHGILGASGSPSPTNVAASNPTPWNRVRGLRGGGATPSVAGVIVSDNDITTFSPSGSVTTMTSSGQTINGPSVSAPWILYLQNPTAQSLGITMGPNTGTEQNPWASAAGAQLASSGKGLYTIHVPVGFKVIVSYGSTAPNYVTQTV